MSAFRKFFVAAALAASLSGCVGVQLTPQERSFGTAVEDLNIQTEFNARLIGDSGALFANVNSTVVEGRLHITGSVPTQADRIKVTKIAWTIPSVREVVNDIDVTSDTGLFEAARDHWITAQVRGLLISDSSVRDSNYAIDTENGVVYLNGIAQDKRELETVVSHASSVAGAKKVVSYVILKDDPRRFQKPGQRVATNAER